VSAERLQKVLANAGFASRRECEELISAGRVAVNGKVMRVLGARVDPAQDEITVDGRPIGRPSPRTYVLLHKPAGVISSADDPQGRPTVVEMVDLPVRLFPIGRLDYESEGLLLLTDDGELAQRLTHPSYQVEKEYHALLDAAPTADALREWRAGVILDGAPTAPAWVEVLERDQDGTWVRVVLHEGRKRQIRAVAGQLGYQVLRLIRVREGPLMLGDLPAGQWRQLADAEVEALWEHVGGRDSKPPRDESDTHERPRSPAQPAAVRHDRRAAPGAARARDDRSLPDGEQDNRRARPPAGDRARPPIRRADDQPRQDDRRDDFRPPRRDDSRPPRRDDRRDDFRPPRRDDSRPPRRDDRRDDFRPPRRDDRRDDFRPPRRDDRRDDFRPPRRDDRPPQEHRQDAEREPRRDDRSNGQRERPRAEPGNERPSENSERQEKRGPGREWRARQSEEQHNRKTAARSRGPAPRWGSRSGTSRHSRPFRPRPPRDDKDES
jgi:23S rRNA pseudouridine2605 synthase